MAAQKTVLITGANRGIGKGFVKAFLSQPDTTVIAAVRDPSHQTSVGLADLPAGAGSKLITVKLDSTVVEDAASAVATLKADHGIEALDVVVANAGIAKDGTSVRKTTVPSLVAHFNVNALGPVVLFQATADLLQASKSGNPKFVAVSTLAGSISGQDGIEALNFPHTMSPYGGSKAALNWYVRRLHFEEPWLTSFVFHPGLVVTDMTSNIFALAGVTPEALGAITPETSVEGMVKVIEGATRAIGGTFQNYDGAVNPW